MDKPKPTIEKPVSPATKPQRRRRVTRWAGFGLDDIERLMKPDAAEAPHSRTAEPARH